MQLRLQSGADPGFIKGGLTQMQSSNLLGGDMLPPCFAYWTGGSLPRKLLK